MRAAGFVLTGGNSTRMGTDKALLQTGDTHLVSAVACTLSELSIPVTLVGRPDRYSHLDWPCISDVRPGQGPLSGIETALAASDAEWNLVVACDMPTVSSQWLMTILQHGQNSTDLSCVATRDADGRVHPLCAAYRKSCLPLVSKALDEHRLRLTAILDEFATEYLQAPVVLPNLNTPSEWERYQSLHLAAH